MFSRRFLPVIFFQISKLCRILFYPKIIRSLLDIFEGGGLLESGLWSTSWLRAGKGSEQKCVNAMSIPCHGDTSITTAQPSCSGTFWFRNSVRESSFAPSTGKQVYEPRGVHGRAVAAQVGPVPRLPHVRRLATAHPTSPRVADVAQDLRYVDARHSRAVPRGGGVCAFVGQDSWFCGCGK